MSEREAALEETHRLLQQFPLDLEKFLAWLTEAETTANVLQDATHKERLLEDSKGVRELMKQWQVSKAFVLGPLVNNPYEQLMASVLVSDMLGTK